MWYEVHGLDATQIYSVLVLYISKGVHEQLIFPVDENDITNVSSCEVTLTCM